MAYPSAVKEEEKRRRESEKEIKLLGINPEMPAEFLRLSHQ